MSAKKSIVEEYNRPFAKQLRSLVDNKDGISPLGRKVKQEEIAKAICEKGIPIKRQTVSLYLNGKALPDLDKFKTIADFFGVSYDYLLGESKSIKRENIDIEKITGLSDSAIHFLTNMKKLQTIHERQHDTSLDVLVIINKLLSENNFSFFYNLAKVAQDLAENTTPIIDDNNSDVLYQLAREVEAEQRNEQVDFKLWRLGKLLQNIVQTLAQDYIADRNEDK